MIDKIMDLKNIFQKNVDTMKSKLPALPKLPKFKSRKIFSLSRSKDNISSSDGNFTSSSNSQLSGRPSQMQLTVPSSIIDRSPRRISTISSLVEGNNQQQIFRSDYDISDGATSTDRHIRFEEAGEKVNDGKKSTHRLTERLTRQYKELSEFKFSHIFGKKTIVRKTEIQVDMYKQSYQEELAADNIQNRPVNSSDMSGRFRRQSTDYEFEIKSIPTEKVVDETVDNAFDVDVGNTLTIPTILPPQTIQVENLSNVNDIESMNYTITPPPLTRRKVFSPTLDESPSPSVENKHKFPLRKLNFKASQKKRSLKKKNNTNETNDGSKGSIHSKNSQKSRGMWQVRRATRIPAAPTNAENSNDENTNGVDNFKKSLTSVFKKFSSVDEPKNTDDLQSPNKSGNSRQFGAMKWPSRKAKSASKENIENIPTTSSPETFELKKQFNKMVDKSKQIKNLINSSPPKDIQPTSSETPEESPSKKKTIEEIETLGYGRKNMKYIEMWKIRRRREIRRNDPFPIDRTNSMKGSQKRSSGMWKVRRPTRIRVEKSEEKQPHMADVAKTLMNLLKRNENPDANQSNSNTATENTSSQGSTLSRMWKFRKENSKDSLDEDGQQPHKNDENNIDKQSFWKKLSIKAKNKTAENPNPEHNNTQPKDDNSMFLKAKKRMEQRFKFVKTKSLESRESQDESLDELSTIDIIQENDFTKTEESVVITQQWRTQRNHPHLYSSSSEEDIITTPGYLRSKYGDVDDFDDFESSTIIVSKPMPTVLHHEPMPPRHQMFSNSESSTSSPLPFHLELPIPVVMPTPPPPKRQVPGIPLSATTSPNSSSTISQLPKSPSPPSLPHSPPPALTPQKSLSHESLLEQQQLLLSSAASSSQNSPFVHLPIIHQPPTIIYQDFEIKSPIGITRPRHSRKVSMDSNDSDSWIPESFVSRSPLTLNKIDETYESWSSIASNDDFPPDPLKKWQSIDIFNGHESPAMAFEDFDDVLKNEPVLTIVKDVEEIRPVIIATITTPSPQKIPIVEEIPPPTTDEETSLTEQFIDATGPTILHEDITEQQQQPQQLQLREQHQQVEQEQEYYENDDDLSDDYGPATGVPILIDKHSITKPLVKQTSMRRQFSEEKDAEDLNKKRNVNKMISRFDPERFSSRRCIKHEKIKVTAVIEPQQAKQYNQNYQEQTLLRNIKQASSLDVEMDPEDSQSVYGFTTEEDSDASDVTITKPVLRTAEKRQAPQPPLSQQHQLLLLQQQQQLIKQQEKLIQQQQQLKQKKQQSHKQPEQRSNVKKPTVSTNSPQVKTDELYLNADKRNVLNTKLQSEDTFYSFDATEEDEAIQGYSLGGRTLVREIYTIDL